MTNRRVIEANYQVRSIQREDGAESREISGRAIVFNSLSVDLGGFREIVDPDAVTKTLRERPVKLLFDHDSGHVLGSTDAGTLTLDVRDDGLYFRNTPPDTQWARDLIVSLERGDITGCSFSFNVISDKWEEQNGQQIRTLKEIELIEISIVAFPAYPATAVDVRADLTISADEIVRLARILHAGPTTPEDRALIDRLISTSTTSSNADEQEPPAGDTVNAEQKLELLRRRLQLVEAEL